MVTGSAGRCCCSACWSRLSCAGRRATTSSNGPRCGSRTCEAARMSPSDAPSQGRSLRSTITSDGEVRLSLKQEPVPELGDGQVLIAVEASPINPSDLGVLLGPMSPAGLTRDGDDLVGRIAPEWLPMARDRLDKPLPVGNEG